MNYHDVLAALGVSSAHPGGFALSTAWIEAFDWSSIERVLDIGCGTGKTACTIAQYAPAVSIVGIDIRDMMIHKARQRASELHVDNKTSFIVADAHQMDFVDQSFDLIIMESVSVFLQIEKAIQEVYRNLKYGGRVIDI